MEVISYSPSNDTLLLKLRSVRGKATREFGRFKLWPDEEGNVCAIAIRPFLDELEEFKQNQRGAKEDRNWIELGGIWSGVSITEDDVKRGRKELLKKLENRWESE